MSGDTVLKIFTLKFAKMASFIEISNYFRTVSIFANKLVRVIRTVFCSVTKFTLRKANTIDDAIKLEHQIIEMIIMFKNKADFINFQPRLPLQVHTTLDNYFRPRTNDICRRFLRNRDNRYYHRKPSPMKYKFRFDT